MFCSECGKPNLDEAKFCVDCGCQLFHSLEPGNELRNGRYVVKKAIKQGAMGAVYEIWDVDLEKRWALKEMISSFKNEEELQEAEVRFKNEARLLSNLNHLGLPRVTDYFTEAGLHYLVMDYVEGEDLEEIIKNEGTPGLSEKLVKNTALEILEILEYLHGQNPPILYRDVKPSNAIRRKSDGKILLVDFGIAKVSKTTIAKTGTKMGTEGYAPIEQYKGKAEKRSDIYALGATMHYMLTGKEPEPFDFEPVRKLAPKVTNSLNSIVMKAVREKANDRFPSAEAMKIALMRLSPVVEILRKGPILPPTYQPPITPTPSTPARPPRMRGKSLVLRLLLRSIQ